MNGPRRSGHAIRTVVSALTLISLSAPAVAQSDAQLWLVFDLGKELSRTWSVSYEQHLRFDQDVSRVAQIMPDVAVTVRVARWMRVVAGYRLQYLRNGSGELVVRHRPYLGGTVRADVATDFRFSARLLFTEQIRGWSSDDLRHGVRAKASAAWRGYRRIRPEVSTEVFYAIADPNGIELDKIRLGAELSTPVGLGAAGLGYVLEFAQRDASDPTVHAILVSYAIELD